MRARGSGRSASRVAIFTLVLAAATPARTPARAETDVARAEVVIDVAQVEESAGQAERASPPVTAAEIERLRAEVQRLATAQRDLERKVEDHALALGGQPPVAPPAESGIGLGPFLFALGGMAGWAASRVVQRRRDRGQRARLRF